MYRGGKIRNSLPGGTVVDDPSSHRQYSRVNLPRKNDDSMAFNIRQLVIFIALMTFANSLFNSLASENGYGYPYATFLAFPQDKYGDLIKYPLSFPGAPFQGVDGWAPLYQKYLNHNDYLGIEAFFQPGKVSNLQGPPLVIVLTLILRWIIWMTNPSFTIYFFIFATTIPLVAFMAALYKRVAWYWLTLGLLISYPFLFMITRGNYGSAIPSIVLIFSMVNCLRKKYPLLTAFLIAIAINMRPNSAIFICLLFTYGSFFNTFRYVLYCVLFAFLTAITSYCTAHWLYPDYTFNNMILGLEQYYKLYVIDGLGLSYGSSFWGILQCLHFGWPAFDISHLDKILILVCLIIAAFALALFRRHLITPENFIMLVCLDYCLFSSPVFADYHLLCLFGMLLLWALKEDSNLGADATWMEKVGICLLLSPKNYLFFGTVSAQVVLNPEILLLLIIYRLCKATKLAFI
jgi:hypothetical protein